MPSPSSRGFAAPLRIVTAAVVVFAACCGTSGGFTDDQRIEITAPGSLETVELPVRLEWKVRHLPPTATQFAAFVDRGAMAPGRSLRSMMDHACQERPGCPDEIYLRQQNIYVTTDAELSLATVPILGGVVGAADQPVHTVTVVMLDRDGRRVSGAADVIELRVRP